MTRNHRAEELLLVWKRTRPHELADLSQIPLPIGWSRESVNSWHCDGVRVSHDDKFLITVYDIVTNEVKATMQVSKTDDATVLGVELVHVMLTVNEERNKPGMARVIGNSDREWLQKMSRR